MKVAIKGMDNVIRAFRGFPKKLRAEVNAEFAFTAREIERQAKRDAPKDQGMLARAITVKKVGEYRHDVVAQSQISPFQEFGTKGKAKAQPEFQAYAMRFKGFRPKGNKSLFESILGWVRRRKIATQGRGTKEQRTRSAAFLIARKIFKEGIEPKPFLLPAFVQARDRLVKRLVNLIKRK